MHQRRNEGNKSRDMHQRRNEGQWLNWRGVERVGVARHTGAKGRDSLTKVSREDWHYAWLSPELHVLSLPQTPRPPQPHPPPHQTDRQAPYER